MTRKHSLDKFSDEEKQKLADMQEQFKAAQKEEPANLREHLQAFNDGVIAIIITIIVLEIQPAINEVHYQGFLGDIAVFLITFFIVADFWYDLHLSFSYYIFRPTKTVAIMDFLLLADLSLFPVMTKWIMAETSTFAVVNFGVVFLIAKVVEILTQYFGAKETVKDSQIMRIVMNKSFVIRSVFDLVINIILIIMSLYIPRVAMILYLIIPVISFIFPNRIRLTNKD